MLVTCSSIALSFHWTLCLSTYSFLALCLSSFFFTFHCAMYTYPKNTFPTCASWMLFLAEYMSGGSLYDYLHKNHQVLKLSQLLKFALDVSKGMEYLHRNDIIHRDLKTANLLLGMQNVWIYFVRWSCSYDSMT